MCKPHKPLTPLNDIIRVNLIKGKKYEKYFCEVFSNLLVVAFSFNLFASECSESRKTGRLTADEDVNSAGWFVGGVASGFLFGIFGTAGIVGISAIPSPEADFLPEDVTEAECFDSGYEKEGRSKNMKAATYGGLVGWAGSIIYLSSIGAYD